MQVQIGNTEQVTVDISFEWRGELSDDELFELTRSHGGLPQRGWWGQVRPHSLGWVTARSGDQELVGFVNVAWDGCDHAFLLDPKTRGAHQRQGIGTELVRIAASNAKVAGCEWLHVDFEPHLRSFYLDACGFRATEAGVVRLSNSE
jgi:hypothetical protein